jgi:hypothetical protein
MKTSQNRLLRRMVAFQEMGLSPSPHVLIDWMNDNRENHRGRRLAGIIEAIRRVEKVKQKAFSDHKTMVSLKNILQEINTTLQVFRVFPHFGPIHPQRWLPYWMPTNAGEMNRWIRTKARTSAESSVGECNAAITLVGLVQRGRLHLVRECSQCRKWFYAKRLRQRFCLTRCLQKAYRSTDRFREHRRQYMRKYRHDVLGLVPKVNVAGHRKKTS